MGGTIIITGHKSIAQVLEEHFAKIAVFRQARARELLEAYYANENSLTRDDEQFLLRCVQDVVENA